MCVLIVSVNLYVCVTVCLHACVYICTYLCLYMIIHRIMFIVRMCIGELEGTIRVSRWHIWSLQRGGWGLCMGYMIIIVENGLDEKSNISCF